MNRLRALPRSTAVLAAALALLLTFGVIGRWRSTATGPQVQVPMFYDAHYLFPRPWTQEQAAPGVPPPAPLAFYGPNWIRQPFVVGSDRLSVLRLLLQGPAGADVDVVVGGPRGAASGRLTLQPERVDYRLTLPPDLGRRGERLTVALAAPNATAEAPVLAFAVGGDRIGGALRLNEFHRPGNLVLATYSGGGLPGRWLLDALGEQLLPQLFRLRLQQYKPDWLKGPLFGRLLAATVALTAVWLIAAAPAELRRGRAGAYGASGLIVAFLLWQLLSGRLLWPTAADLALVPTATPPAFTPPTATPALVFDWSAQLWTLERLPEARFVETAVRDGRAAVRAPAPSSVALPLILPEAARLQVGIGRTADAPPLTMRVLFDDQTLYAGEPPADGSIVPLDLDLAAWGGRAGTLRLIAEPNAAADAAFERPAAVWVQPQLVATRNWLRFVDQLDPEARPIGPVRFSGGAALRAIAAAPDRLTLYWEAVAPAVQDAAVFVHVLDAAGQIVAQADGPPLGGAYPQSVWEPGVLVQDARPLGALPAGVYDLAIGLYDPRTSTRETATGPDGAPLPDGRLLIPGGLVIP